MSFGQLEIGGVSFELKGLEETVVMTEKVPSP